MECKIQLIDYTRPINHQTTCKDKAPIVIVQDLLINTIHLNLSNLLENIQPSHKALANSVNWTSFQQAIVNNIQIWGFLVTDCPHTIQQAVMVNLDHNKHLYLSRFSDRILTRALILVVLGAEALSISQLIQSHHEIERNGSRISNQESTRNDILDIDIWISKNELKYCMILYRLRIIFICFYI